MFMKKHLRKWTKEEKERIILSIQKLGPVAGCRQYGLSRSLYYQWLERYNAQGIEGLSDRRGQNLEGQVKQLEKQVKDLKELLGDRDLEIKMKDELLKKKFGPWKTKGS